MPLTSQQIRNVKAEPTRTLKLFDGGGLYLEITPKGSKRWRLKYRYNRKEKLISLGLFPTISLKEARTRRDEARGLLSNNIDPSEHRKKAKQVAVAHILDSFEHVAHEWISRNEAVWSVGHKRTVLSRLQKDVFPFIGNTTVKQITPPELLIILRRIEERGAVETAHRVKTAIGQVFRYAIATGQAISDPTRDLRGALRPVRPTHLAAITDPAKAGELLRMIEGYQGGPIVRAALRLAPLVFVRPGELRTALWNEIDFGRCEWRFVVKKTNSPHIVPLSSQSIRLLNEIYPLTGTSEYVFPSPRTFSRPMSDNAVLAALRSMGIPKDEMCGHGFRAMARTILDEVLGFPVHLIEHQLSHAVKDTLGRAYNRTKHLPERQAMMQKWADYLDELKGSKNHAETEKKPSGLGSLGKIQDSITG